MKRKITLFVFILISFHGFSQTNSLDSAWVRDNYYKMERMIPMRDGAKLFTAIYIPKDTTQRHPILMKRTPYSAAPYGENNFPESFWNSYYRLYMRENYIMVVQDVRGRYMSEGDFVDIRPFDPNKKGNQFDEASDTYDAIQWLIENVPYNNERVGVFGISYPGFYASMAGLSGHQALKAVSPQAPVTDWFMGDDFHHNGAFMLMDAFSFYSGFGKPRPVPTTQGSRGYQIQGSDNYDFFLKTGSLKNFSKLFGDSIQFWKDLYAHPNLDDWWKARNVRNFVTHYKPATLIVGGLFDAEDVFGAWNLYKAIESKSRNDVRIVMGPWFHGQWGGRGDGSSLGNIRFGSKTSEWYQNNIEVPFFNYHLKGKGDIRKIPEASVFFTGENNWNTTDPFAHTESENMYLQPGGGLSWTQPSSSGGFTQYTSDPAKPVPYTEDIHLSRTREYMTDDQRFASRRPDVIVFETEVLKEDVTLSGPLYANLYTSISTTDADFVVKLIDVFPNDFRYEDAVLQPGRSVGGSYPMAGYQMLVRGEVMRGKYRNSFETPQPFTPNKIEKVNFYLPDIAHTFKKGHKVMVQIQSSWFPLVDRNPQHFVNIYEATANDFRKADIRIYHNQQYPSSIILPVLKKD